MQALSLSHLAKERTGFKGVGGWGFGKSRLGGEEKRKDTIESGNSVRRLIHSQIWYSVHIFTFSYMYL